MKAEKAANPGRVFGALIFLTAVEVGLVYMGFSKPILVALLIGTSMVKASLVALYFMHLKFERLIIWAMILGTCLIAGIFLTALIPDIVIGN